MEYLYRQDRFIVGQEHNLEKVSANIWDGNKYPHKRYIELQNENPNGEIFSLSFWIKEDYLIRHLKLYCCTSNTLSILTRFPKKSEFLGRYECIDDDGLPSQAVLYYQCRDPEPEELQSKYSNEILPIDEREILDIDGKWKKICDSNLFKYLDSYRNLIEAGFHKLDNTGDNDVFYYSEKNKEILIYHFGELNEMYIDNVLNRVISKNKVILNSEYKIYVLTRRKIFLIDSYSQIPLEKRIELKFEIYLYKVRFLKKYKFFGHVIYENISFYAPNEHSEEPKSIDINDIRFSYPRLILKYREAFNKFINKIKNSPKGAD